VSGTSRVRTAVAHAGASASRGARTCRTHGFEYYRHGTLSLFAALDTRSGEVLAHTMPRNTRAAFVEFLGDIVASQPQGVDRSRLDPANTPRTWPP
jgi:hypothetical protein